MCLRLPRLHRPGRDTRGFAHNALCPRAALTRSGTADLQHSEPDQSRDTLQSRYEQNFTTNTLTDNGTQNQRTTEEPQNHRTSHTSFVFYHESKIYDRLDMIKGLNTSKRTNRQTYVTITVRKTDYKHHTNIKRSSSWTWQVLCLKDISWRCEKTCGFDSQTPSNYINPYFTIS